MTDSFANLKKRCLELKKKGLHNSPCSGPGVTADKLKQLLASIEKNSNQQPSLETPVVLNRPPSPKKETESVEPIVRVWSSPEKENDPVIDQPKDDDEECQNQIKKYDSRFHDWLITISGDRGPRSLSWCNLYKELLNIGKYVWDEEILYAIADDDRETLLSIIDRENPGDNFADRFPSLMDVFIRGGLLTAKGYLVSHDESYVVSSPEEIENVICYISSTRTAKSLRDFYMKSNKDNLRYKTSIVLLNETKNTNNFLEKKGKLLFLAQSELMLSKVHAKFILQSLYDFVAANEAFLDQIIDIIPKDAFEDVLNIASKRNAANSLKRLLDDERSGDSSKSYLLISSANLNLLENVKVLIKDPRVDPTNGGTYEALKQAAKNGNKEIFDLIRPKYPPYQERPKLPIVSGIRTAAVQGGNYYIVVEALKFPASDDDEALSAAVHNLDAATISLLLKNKDTVVNWTADAISTMLSRPKEQANDFDKLHVLRALFERPNIQLPLDDTLFYEFLASHGIKLLEMFFANRKKYPSVVIDSLIAAAENMESKEEYDYIIQKAGL